MSYTTTVLFGALTGATLFLGLPLARWRPMSARTQGFLLALATGILVFLLWDVLANANGPVDEALARAHDGHASAAPALVAVFLAGLALGFAGPQLAARRLAARVERGAGDGPGAAIAVAAPAITGARSVALTIAVGLGLHNFSEGLAIGQASATGAIAFAGVLIIGFGLHNITEGLGIAAPLTSDGAAPTWRFLGLVGLVGAGPTLLGTAIGYGATSTYLYVLCLTLAAGALIHVVNEVLAVCRRKASPVGLGAGLLLGFAAAYATDLFLTFLGS
ncbi:MAG TPA: ZIP family metal transporter [Candidatus Dormibacteraeota bacterium]